MTTTNPSRPLRIVHYVPGIRLEQGGVVRSILDWCSVLAARGHDMTVMTYTGPDLPKEWTGEKPGLPKTVLIDPPTPAWNNLLKKSAIEKAAPVIASADVLHLHGPWLNGNLQMARIARENSVPYIVTVHGMLDDWTMSQRPLRKRIFLALGGKDCLEHSAVVHFTAAAELEQAKKWIGSSRTFTLPCLLDLKNFQNLPPRPKTTDVTRPKRILILGRLHEQKGIDILLHAAAILRDRGANFELIIAGRGPAAYETELQELSRRLSLKNHAKFVGLVVGEEKLKLYQSADLFVLPTRHENFGIVLIESLACGTPIVTTRGTDIWMELQNAGGWITGSSPQDIAEKIAEALADDTALRTRAESGKKWVFEELNADRLAGEYESLYRRIMTSSRGA